MESHLEIELNKFSKEQRKIIYENVFAIELNEGCSIGCDFCAFEAIRGVKNQFEFRVLKRIAEEIAELTNRVGNKPKASTKPALIRLYDATDPLDYSFENKNYFDCHRLFTEKGFDVAVSSAIPKGKEELAVENIGRIHQISISHMNRERLEPYFKQLGVFLFIDLFNFSRAKNGKNGFHLSVYQVEKNLEEEIRVLKQIYPDIPTKTRFYDIRKDKNQLRWKSQDLENLFLFCGNRGQNVQGKIVDRDYLQVRNNGRAFNLDIYDREYPLDPLIPFCDVNGVKITPNGIFNYVSSEPNQNNTSGILTERIDPKNFRVVKWSYSRKLCSFNNIPFGYYV